MKSQFPEAVAYIKKKKPHFMTLNQEGDSKVNTAILSFLNVVAASIKIGHHGDDYQNDPEVFIVTKEEYQELEIIEKQVSEGKFKFD